MPRPYYKSYPGITALARELRKNQTLSEILVWDILRRKKLSGYKFIRQHPIFYRIDKNWVDFYVADFYCAKLKLIIEVDGKIHEEQTEYDKERDARLSEKGIYVARIKNEEVKNINKVTSTINDVILQRAREI
jgi:leucyl-tRNA synthetase